MPPLSRCQIVFNGKFLSARRTGVQRVATEMIVAVDRIVAAAPPYEAAPICTLAVPLNADHRLDLPHMGLAIVGRLTGQLWEQILLPLFVKRQRLINLCNLGPLIRPDVIMIHDAHIYISPESYSALFRLFYRFAQPLMARRAAVVLTVSYFSRDMLIKYGVAPAGKITVIHNGVNHILRVAANMAILEKLDVEIGGYAVALSNTQRHKNISVLLQAFGESGLHDLKLVLVGSATRDEFVALGQEPPPNVIFAGRIDDEDYRGLLEGAACLAFPSTTEGFGLPPLEALILGCPAVVAPCGALPEVCGNAAVYAAPDDANAWVEAIRAYAQNWQLREAAGEAGRRWAAAFTWERSAKQLIEVLAYNHV